MDEVLAFMQREGLPLSMPLEEVVALMERAIEAGEVIPGEWGELYVQIEGFMWHETADDSAERETALERLHHILYTQSTTASTLEAVRMKSALQRLENNAKDWTPSRGARTHRFEYLPPEADGPMVAVLTLTNVEHDESLHRTFLDAMEAAE